MKTTIKIINKDRFPNTVVTRAWCNYPGGTSDGNCPDNRSWPCETCDHCMATISDGNNPVVKPEWEIARKRWWYRVKSNEEKNIKKV